MLGGRAGKESVLRAWQPEISSERCSLIFAAQQPARLQLRHDAIDEIVESSGEVGEHNVETVGGFGEEPFFHLVGNRSRRANKCQAAIATDTLRELPHRQ